MLCEWLTILFPIRKFSYGIRAGRSIDEPSEEHGEANQVRATLGLDGTFDLHPAHAMRPPNVK